MRLNGVILALKNRPLWAVLVERGLFKVEKKVGHGRVEIRIGNRDDDHGDEDANDDPADPVGHGIENGL